MKKCLSVLVAVLCSLMIMVGVASAHTYNYNFVQANELVHGVWYDTVHHHTFNANDVKVINGKGYTDPMGDSLVYFTHSDGTEARMAISYNAEQNRYYAEYETAYTDGGDALQWKTWYNSMVRE